MGCRNGEKQITDLKRRRIECVWVWPQYMHILRVCCNVAHADQGSVKAPCQYRLAMGSINEGSAFSMHSAIEFKCNFVVIDVVHSGIKMTGSYFSEFRWNEKCCNSLHEYKDYSKTHPLPQYVQMINFIPITQCSPKWYCDACRTARAWRKRMAQRCPVNRQHRVVFYMGSLGF